MYNVHPMGKLSKDSGLRLRVDSDLRKEFLEACRSKDITAAQVLRAYMRKFVEENKDHTQRQLFNSMET